MNRQLKTFDQLRTLITQEAQKFPKLGALQPALEALSQRDPSGCNWAVIGWRSLEGVEAQPSVELQQLVKSYQHQFNAIGRAPNNQVALLPQMARDSA